MTEPLAEPGHSDLTSNVDFSHLTEVFAQSGGRQSLASHLRPCTYNEWDLVNTSHDIG